MDEKCENTYFLSRNHAFKTALEQQVVQGKSGEHEIQKCYYTGEPFHIHPKNLIHVPVDKFVYFFSNNSCELPTKIDTTGINLDNEELKDLESTFQEMIQEIRRLRKSRWGTKPKKLSPQDTYFFDKNEALENAKQMKRVELDHNTIDGLQVCYFDGESTEYDPANFIGVPFYSALEFFSFTRLRLPTFLAIPTGTSEDDADTILNHFEKILSQAALNRIKNSNEYFGKCRGLAPEWNKNNPLRIFFMSNRLTTVMKYCTKSLARTFEELGCSTFVSVENNEMEALDSIHHLNAYYQFRPHITVNINHINNEFLHPEVFNVTWWQDPMQDLVDNQQLPVRDRDVFYALDHEIELLKKCGVKEAYLQDHCVDMNVFRKRKKIPRRDKAVFVGSNYYDFTGLTKDKFDPSSVRLVEEFIDSSQTVTHSAISDLAKKCSTPLDKFLQLLYSYVIREKTVQWLCLAENIEVEIYGRGWGNDPIVSSFFKGEIEHGDDLAELYSSAKYALISSGMTVHLTRLGEATACECIPVIFDIREVSNPPFWEKSALYFRTAKDLYKCLQTEPLGSVLPIAHAMSYKRFVQRIIKLLSEKSPEIAANKYSQEIIANHY